MNMKNHFKKRNCIKCLSINYLESELNLIIDNNFYRNFQNFDRNCKNFYHGAILLDEGALHDLIISFKSRIWLLIV